jgi:hypothetical protein
MKSQRKFMDWASTQLNIKDMSDWYKVTNQVTRYQKIILKFQQLIDLGGSSLLSVHKGSFSRLLSEVYPNYDWLPWRFPQCPQKYWDKVDNQRKFMGWATKELKIKEMSDWYKVSFKVTFFSIVTHN